MDIQTKDGILLRGIPDGTPDEAIKARIEQIRASTPPVVAATPVTAPTPPAETRSKREGREMNSSVQGLFNALQGPTLGFADEIYGALSAGGKKVANVLGIGGGQSFKQDYEEGRDTVRGATEQFREDRPITATTTSLMAGAPTVVMAPAKVASGAPAVLGLGSRSLQAAKTGAAFGAVGGAGESTASDVGGLIEDTLKGAAMSAGLGGAATVGGAGVAAAGSNVAQRISQSSAANAAREKVAEALIRDAHGTAFQTGRANPLDQASARMGKLGNEATIADSGGTSTRALLDTIATLPGRTKDAVENLIHTRQVGRYGRIAGAADDALGTQGKGYTATLDALDTAKQTQAKPFYDQIETLSVRVDPELSKLIKAAENAHGGAETLAKVKQQAPIDLSLIKAGDDVPFMALDKVKQSLYDLSQTAKQSGSKTLGSAYDDLRIKLTKKLEDLSPKDAAGSIYKQARDAYAGPAQLRDAVEAGRGAMKADAIGVAELMKGMSASEREAFRIGALQSIRDKAGTESGQTVFLKMAKEPSTSGRLKEIFGDDYREFATTVAAEARLKKLESVGRGSQTASRLYGAGDLDVSAVGDVGNIVKGSSTGNVAQALAGAASAWNRVKTPEATRDEIGRILMSRGATGTNELNSMTQSMRRVAEERARAAARTGAASSLYLVQ